jgi:hypothetical protein
MSGTVLRANEDHGPEHGGPVFEVPDDEDKVLDYTLRQRQAIILTMTGKKGEDLKDLSPREMDVVLAALDGMDRVALGRKRLRSENIALANQAAAAAVIAKILGTPGIGQAGRGAAQQPGELSTAVPMLPAGVPEPALVPGETDMEAAQMNVDSFMAGFGTAE